VISILICSRDKQLLAQVSANIDLTIGVEYEIIAIDNAEGGYSISEAYNKGAKQSKYNILCFMHEDVIFHTCNWGQLVNFTLRDQTIGLIGACGSIYKSRFPSAWIHIPQKYWRANMGWTDRLGIFNEYVINPDQRELSEVVVLDGLWLVTRKEVWQEVNFDERNLRGFHFYDLDFSIRVLQKYKLVINHLIFVEHFSQGSFNNSWIKAAISFHKNWSKKLPLFIGSFSQPEIKFLETYALKEFIKLHIRNRYFNKNLIRALLKYYTKRSTIGDVFNYLKRMPFKKVLNFIHSDK
jgi:hypothetical protein